MKKTKLFSALAIMTAIFLSDISQAKIWRVNNNSNYNGVLFGDNLGGTPGYPVYNQFSSLDTSQLSNGDTIHIEPSLIKYNQFDVTKRLVIIGSGYFLSENQKTANQNYNSSVNKINFWGGSEFSQVIGMDFILFFTGEGVADVYCNDITIKRCKFDVGIGMASWPGVSTINILQNYFAGTGNAIGSIGSPWTCPADIVFNNNIVKGTLLWNSGTTQLPINTCNNNVFDGPVGLPLLLNFSTTSFQNNILKTLNANANINNNTFASVDYTTCTDSSQFPGTSNLVIEPNMANVFQTTFPSTDGKYQLNPAWATTNPGSNGHRGAFGGPPSNRYTLSGLAAIPVIYDVTTSGISSGGLLPVIVKARTIK